MLFVYFTFILLEVAPPTELKLLTERALGPGGAITAAAARAIITY